ncbi:phosphoglycerate mutase [Microtetraspora sp. NBRC 13810]|uniref:histidine phosphatase family protein n=1 Tax=Microtetraspora sp. NBRC 13810 TaxID=3030990 RepID=UPI0024A56A22|nr:histidine phosphatase family protein [Microtetraspora sp. NBRC 13810]GLW12825.1 phosphoglycerate mutase [Microtetraspora sp. NBRC 13810]
MRRLILVRHATTPGMRAACFPAGEHADPAGLAQARTLVLPARAALFSAPEPAARQTAEALGPVAGVLDAFADADPGRWRGRPYAVVAQDEPDALRRWREDPEAAPHGGESVAAMARRVSRWLDEHRTTATDPDPGIGPNPSPGPGSSLGSNPSLGPGSSPGTGTSSGPGSGTGGDGMAGTVVVCCDAGAIRAALCHALGLPPGAGPLFDLAPLSVSELNVTGAGWRIGCVNRIVQKGPS